MRRMLLTMVLIVCRGAVADDEDAAAKLDLHAVKLEAGEDGLAGEMSYSLVVGTYYEWNTDPTAVPGLFSELNKETGIRARVDFRTVSLDSEGLFGNPLLIMTGNRFFSLSDEELDNLRRYLEAGGFIYADDCGGADWSFRYMIKKLLPDHEMVEVPADHPVFSSHYKLTAVPKILDLYGGDAKALGVFIDGRLAVLYTFDTDVPCGWEKNPDGSFVHLLTPEKHEQSMKFGINVVMHVLQELHKRINAKNDAADGAEPVAEEAENAE